MCSRLSEKHNWFIAKDQEDLFALADSIIMYKYGTVWSPMYYFNFMTRLLYPLTYIEELRSIRYLKQAELSI